MKIYNSYTEVLNAVCAHLEYKICLPVVCLPGHSKKIIGSIEQNGVKYITVL